MPGLTALKERHREPEIMDDPALAADLHVQALRGLGRLNFAAGTANVLWRYLRPLLQPLPATPLRVLDIGTGGGDIPIRLARRARRAGLALDVAGCDLSERAIEMARQQAAHAGADVHFFRLDVLEDDIPANYDVLTSSLFLHHLSETEVVALLGKLKTATRRLVLFSDLKRSAYGFALAFIFTRLLSRSRVAQLDGPRSVRAAYTVAELRALAAAAGLTGAAVVGHSPARLLLKWSPT